jgi:hypothetical protein
MDERTPAPRLHLRSFVLLALILAAAATRFVPYLFPGSATGLWNFTPVIAIALFGGARFANRWVGFAVPLGIMLVSDVILQITGWAPLTNIWEVLQQVATYAVLLLTVAIGLGLQGTEDRLKRGLPSNWLGHFRSFLISVGLIGGATIGSAVVFFLLSNFVVWLTASETMPPEFQYPKTLAGLIDCYVKALPFAGGTFSSSVYYAVLLFGGFGLVQAAAPSLQRQREAELAPA